MYPQSEIGTNIVCYIVIDEISPSTSEPSADDHVHQSARTKNTRMEGMKTLGEYLEKPDIPYHPKHEVFRHFMEYVRSIRKLRKQVRKLEEANSRVLDAESQAFKKVEQCYVTSLSEALESQVKREKRLAWFNNKYFDDVARLEELKWKEITDKRDIPEVEEAIQNIHNRKQERNHAWNSLVQEYLKRDKEVERFLSQYQLRAVSIVPSASA